MPAKKALRALGCLPLVYCFLERSAVLLVSPGEITLNVDEIRAYTIVCMTKEYIRCKCSVKMSGQM